MIKNNLFGSIHKSNLIHDNKYDYNTINNIVYDYNEKYHKHMIINNE